VVAAGIAAALAVVVPSAELAAVLASIYGNLEMVPQLEKMAKERIARVKRLNNRPRLLGHDGTPIGNQDWDIRSRGYR